MLKISTTTCTHTDAVELYNKDGAFSKSICTTQTTIDDISSTSTIPNFTYGDIVNSVMLFLLVVILSTFVLQYLLRGVKHRNI